MDKIFVQIASYRDVELPRTIESAIESAQYPSRLTFGICWQYDEYTYTDLDGRLCDNRFSISQVYYEESRGCCWARNQTNLLYQGEKYTLQVDAHTRFAQDWDSRYIAMLESIDSDKPVLSTYPAPYKYVDGREQLCIDRGMQRLVMGRMFRNLTTVFKTELVEDGSKPAPSKFLGAGQIFTLGQFCRDVEYDPELYHAGEEINLSVRAFTHGYDFFCPNDDLVWHYYQHPMPHHWSDHGQTQDQQAIARLRTLFVGDHTELGRHGLGTARKLAEYEQHSGTDFKARLYRRREKCHFKREVQLDVSGIDERCDYDFWIFSLRDIDDEEIYRRDIYDKDVLERQTDTLLIDEELEDEAFSYMIWPHTEKDGFLAQHFHEL